MGQEIRGFPIKPKDGQTVTLGNKRFRFVFTWRQRAASWYFDLYQADGTAIALGRRMSPKALPLAHVGFAPGVAPRFLFIRGEDGYLRDDLGDTLVLTRYAEDELEPTATASDVVVI